MWPEPLPHLSLPPPPLSLYQSLCPEGQHENVLIWVHFRTNSPCTATIKTVEAEQLDQPHLTGKTRYFALLRAPNVPVLLADFCSALRFGFSNNLTPIPICSQRKTRRQEMWECARLLPLLLLLLPLLFVACSLSLSSTSLPVPISSLTTPLPHLL